MKNQKYTSANTSINKNRLPALYNKVYFSGHVLDYGCGKYTTHLEEKALESAKSIHFYDCYNQPAVTNEEAMDYGCSNGYDMIVCCNVLNVIDSVEVIHHIIGEMLSLVKKNGYSKVYIQIYEGDRSCNGKVTKNDCYQRNEPTSAYFNFIMNNFDNYHFNTRWKDNIIELSNIFVKGV
mgnify:CR=1 FL=1